MNYVLKRNIQSWFFLVFIVSCESTVKTIQTEKIWKQTYSHASDYLPFDEFILIDTTGILIDNWSVEHKVKYKINEKDIFFINGIETFQLQIDSVAFDRIVLGSNVFISESLTNRFQLELANMQGKELSQSDLYHSVKLGFSESNGVQLKLGDKICEFPKIPEYLDSGHSLKSKSIRLFVDKNIKLTELATVYLWLSIAHIDKVKFITNAKGLNKFSYQEVNVYIASENFDKFKQMNNIDWYDGRLQKIVETHNNPKVVSFEDIKQDLNYAFGRYDFILIDKHKSLIEYIKLLTMVNNLNENLIEEGRIINIIISE